MDGRGIADDAPDPAHPVGQPPRLTIGMVARLPQKDGRSLLIGRMVFVAMITIIIIGGLNSGWPF